VSWGGAFETWLASGQTLYPRYMLEVETIPEAPGGSGTIPGEIIGTDGGHVAVRFQAQSVNPRSWESTVGAFSVDLNTTDIEGLMETVRRGSPISLLMGAPGWERDAFERVALGRLVNVTAPDAAGPVFRLGCADLFSLPSRFDTQNGNLLLFSGTYAAGSTTTLSADYDSVSPDGSISLASTAALGRPTGGEYLVMVTPTGGGDPFYLVGSAKGASSMTIDTPGANRYGTTRVDANSGDTVTFLSLLRGHPLDLIRQILTSTGNGINGTYDVLPEAWGLALPDHLIDHVDIGQYIEGVNFPSSTYEWSLILSAPLTSGFVQLRSIFAEAGFFLTVHEGQITCRAAQDPRDPIVGPFWSITPDDIDSDRPLTWEAWDAQVASELSGVIVNGPTQADGTLMGSHTELGSTNITTAPAYPASLYPRTLSHAWHLTDNVCQETAERLYPWHATVPERLSIPMAGLIHHRLGLGTLVEVTIPTVYSRDAGGPLIQRTGMVVRQAPDWQRGPVVDVVLLPNSSTSPHG